ncbi:hypothetical protein MTY81_42010 [Mycolicibacterium sp. TY81]|nr:hypothetical protein MTY81_42010 [Mycolicibacterium sp. TY81]
MNTTAASMMLISTAAASLTWLRLGPPEDIVYAPYPERLKLPDAPYTAREMSRTMVTTTISEVRTA